MTELMEQSAACSVGMKTLSRNRPPVESQGLQVKEILGRRERDGKVEYLVKREGCPLDVNTWEPVDDLRCPALIQKYDELMSQATKGASSVSVVKRKKRNDTEPRGFNRGLEPERVLGATKSGGEIMLLMKWKDSNLADVVPAKDANLRCPDVVIRFYEERLMWETGSEDDK